MQKRKINKKNILFMSIIFVFLIITVTNCISLCVKIHKIKKERNIFETRLALLLEKEQNLKQEAEKLNDPDYIARYAREKYLFSKDGEFNIRIQ